MKGAMGTATSSGQIELVSKEIVRFIIVAEPDVAQLAP